MEPTWGDLKKLNLICSGLNTSNKNQLISAFGSSTVISDLQMCGNANSHFNKDRIDKIILAKVRYTLTL